MLYSGSGLVKSMRLYRPLFGRPRVGSTHNPLGTCCRPFPAPYSTLGVTGRRQHRGRKRSIGYSRSLPTPRRARVRPRLSAHKVKFCCHALGSLPKKLVGKSWVITGYTSEGDRFKELVFLASETTQIRRVLCCVVAGSFAEGSYSAL